MVTQDSDGFIWVATLDGAARFDGDTFECFDSRNGLCGDQVYAVGEDRAGNIWFATSDGGAGWYDGTSFHALDDGGALTMTEDDRTQLHEVRYRVPQTDKRSLYFLHIDRLGRVWFTGVGVVGYFDGERYCDLMPEYRERFGPDLKASWPVIYSMCEDEAGTCWFWGFFLPGLVGYNDSGFFLVETPAATSGGFALAAGPGGEVWWVANATSAGMQGALWSHKGVGGQLKSIDLDTNVRRIRFDSRGRMWLCTGTQGIRCRDEFGTTALSTDDGLAYDAVNDVYEDREGLLWVATWGGGLCRYDADSVQLLDRRHGLPHTEVLSLREDARGAIWMGFGSGAGRGATLDNTAAVFANGRFESVPQAEGMTTGICCDIQEDEDGRMWFCGPGGVVRSDGSRFANVELPSYRSTDEAGVPTILKKAPSGAMVMGVVYSFSQDDDVLLLRHDGEAIEVICTLPGAGSWVHALIVSRSGEIWFSTGNNGHQWQGRGLGRVGEKGDPIYLTTADGLVQNNVTALCEDRRGYLWIGTRGGLSRFSDGEFTNFTTEDGLPSNGVRCLSEDRHGHLWVGTDGGIARFNRQVFQTLRSTPIAPANCLCEGGQGEMWIGTIEGAARYVTSKTAPGVRIAQVVADKVYGPTQELELYAPLQQLTFEFKGSSFRSGSADLLYTWRLTGVEEAWRRPERRGAARYANLVPGEYLFEVKAIDRDFNESAAVRLRLTVHPDPVTEGINELLSQAGTAGDFVGKSEALLAVQTLLAEVAATDLSVLILGETGTGKGLAARMVHALSARAGKAFVQVNCGAMPESLVESELFGHEKGAFTGAVARKLGKVELAAGGTLFLDEIGDMSPESQVKLLRLLEEGEYERVGGNRTLQADVRIVAATNRHLRQMVEVGRFREDLFFRLNVFPVRLPSLRERSADIPLLATYFMERMTAHLNKKRLQISPRALEALVGYRWPGNVRELEHVVKRAVVVCKGRTLQPRDIALEFSNAPTGARDETLTLREHERLHIEQVLENVGWRIEGDGGAAALLGLAGSTLRSRMKKLEIERPPET